MAISECKSIPAGLTAEAAEANMATLRCAQEEPLGELVLGAQKPDIKATLGPAYLAQVIKTRADWK